MQNQLEEKLEWLLNTKKLNDNIVFGRYLLSHKESVINATRGKKFSLCLTVKVDFDKYKWLKIVFH